MTAGERIKLIRKEKGMTQKQVADRCGMADSAIRKYESGQVTPKQDTLQRIANALGVHLLDLIGIGEELEKLLNSKKDKAREVYPLKIHLSQAQLTATIEHLGALVSRYEAEAAVLAPLGQPGREIAEKRLQAAKSADELQSYLLRQ